MATVFSASMDHWRLPKLFSIEGVRWVLSDDPRGCLRPGSSAEIPAKLCLKPLCKNGTISANGRGRSGGQAGRGDSKAFPRLKQPLFAVLALRELESACRVSLLWDAVTVPQSAFQSSPRVARGSAAVCDPNPPRPFARSRIFGGFVSRFWPSVCTCVWGPLNRKSIRGNPSLCCFGRGGA